MIDIQAGPNACVSTDVLVGAPPRADVKSRPDYVIAAVRDLADFADHMAEPGICP